MDSTEGAQALSLLDPEPATEREAVSIVVPGRPRPWQRTGYNKKTGQRFTRPEDTVHRDTVARTWQYETGRRHFGSEPVALEVEAVFDRPVSHFGSGRNANLVRAAAPRFPGKNLGDLDNLVKAVKDALSGVAFNDDAQVVRSTECKRWAVAGEHAHLRVTLAPV